MSNTGELEREVEASRERLGATVDALKEKMSLGQMFDEMAHFIRDNGGSEIASNLARQVRDNPLPLALVGAGVAWLILGKRTSAADRTSGDTESYPYGEDAYQRHAGLGAKVGEGARSAVGAAGAGLAAVGHGAAETGRMASEAAGSVAHGVEAAATNIADAAHRASDAIRSSARGAAGGASQLGQSITNLLSQDPLVLGAIGLGVGAALGALLPATEVEDRAFGETRDRLAEDAERLAAEGISKAKEMATEAYDTVKSEAERRIGEVGTDHSGETRPSA